MEDVLFYTLVAFDETTQEISGKYGKKWYKTTEGKSEFAKLLVNKVKKYTGYYLYPIEDVISLFKRNLYLHYIVLFFLFMILVFEFFLFMSKPSFLMLFIILVTASFPFVGFSSLLITTIAIYRIIKYLQKVENEINKYIPCELTIDESFSFFVNNKIEIE